MQGLEDDHEEFVRKYGKSINGFRDIISFGILSSVVVKIQINHRRCQSSNNKRGKGKDVPVKLIYFNN